ncbi:MAG: 50S ribosomal protein L1, partial [Planctomycetota bacterium]
MARRHSRRFTKAQEQVDKLRSYQALEGIKLLQSLPKPKFEESVEVAVRLGINPKKTDQLVRGSVSL